MAALLRKIPLGAKELGIIKDKAESLRDGLLTTRGETLLPLTLAHFIFDALCVPSNCTHAMVTSTTTGCSSASASSSSKGLLGVGSSSSSSIHAYRTHADELLGFEATVTTLGLKANVSEAEHPLLCEGTRRMRGELALALLVHYKDDQNKLNRIMDKLLDKDVHQLYNQQKNNAPGFPSKSMMMITHASSAAGAACSVGGDGPDS